MSHGGNLSLRELNNYEIMYEGIERGGFAWRLHGVRLMDSNKLAYSGHQGFPTCPDALASGQPALRVLTSDPSTYLLCVLCGL